MDITITAYRPVEEPAKLRSFPDMQRMTHFAAIQLGPDSGYKVDLEFQWEGGALFGADIPITESAYDIAFLVFNEQSEEWLSCPNDQPIYPGSEWTLDELGPHIRRFIDIYFVGTMATA
jgi:hypothetical protein